MIRSRISTNLLTAEYADWHPLGRRADPATATTAGKGSGAIDPNYQPGAWTTDPRHINNRAFFALFALLGVAMILAAIWFFFWAKNGGFRFQRGDWDDYKSTVLRRKGPNGTTLSGATRSTKLGGGSIVADEGEGDDEKGFARWKSGKFDDSRYDRQDRQGRRDYTRRGNKNNEDADVRAYRHERAARVGGLNRESDGLDDHATRMHGYAYSDVGTDELSSASVYKPINTPKRSARAGNPAGPHDSPRTPSPNKRSSHLYDEPQSNRSSDSHRPLRTHAAPLGHSPTPSPNHRTSAYRDSYSSKWQNSRTAYKDKDAMKPRMVSSENKQTIPGSFCDDDAEEVQNAKNQFNSRPRDKTSGPAGRHSGYRRDPGRRGTGLSDSE